MNEILLQSNKVDYGTPQWLFDKLNKEFDFGVDVCANKENSKCHYYIDNCLTINDWTIPFQKRPICFMNPPYGRQIGKFIKKAYEESLKGCTVVCLLAARTDTRWWWDYCLKAIEIRFLKGRLKFGGGEYSAPFPSAIVIFTGRQENNPVIKWTNYDNRKTNK